MFKKDDKAKKSRPELITPEFILGVGSVLAFGAEKYDAWNWQNMTEIDIERIRGALLRHTLASASGEVIDPESGLSHMYHIGCNAMFINWWELQNESE